MTRWEMTLNGTFLHCWFPITTHPHPRAASLGLAVVAKPAGVLKIYLLKHVVQHHLFHSWWKAEVYRYCSATCRHTQIMQKSGGNLIPWCYSHHLFAVLDSSHATWARWSAPTRPGKTTGKNQPKPGPFAFWGVMKWPVPENGHNVTHPTPHHSDKN